MSKIFEGIKRKGVEMLFGVHPKMMLFQRIAEIRFHFGPPQADFDEPRQLAGFHVLIF
jgi:hypothetical protein